MSIETEIRETLGMVLECAEQRCLALAGVSPAPILEATKIENRKSKAEKHI